MLPDTTDHIIKNEPARALTWRDIEVEKWGKKAKNCQCRPEKNAIQDRCRLINDDCAYGVCPFVYWDCL